MSDTQQVKLSWRRVIEEKLSDSPLTKLSWRRVIEGTCLGLWIKVQVV